MAVSQLSAPPIRAAFRPISAAKHTFAPKRTINSPFDGHSWNWALRLSLVDQSPARPAADLNRLVEFLYEDLPHLFDDQGIDRTAYDERVKFRDPITKHDSITGYLLNIAFLKIVFKPQFQLHWAKQPGPYEITTKWTMNTKFMPLPWKPELIFTGTSVMGVNPETGKFCSHVGLHEILKEEIGLSEDSIDWKETMERSFLRMDDEIHDWSRASSASNCRCELQSPNCDAVRSTAVVSVIQYAVCSLVN